MDEPRLPNRLAVLTWSETLLYKSYRVPLRSVLETFQPQRLSRSHKPGLEHGVGQCDRDRLALRRLSSPLQEVRPQFGNAVTLTIEEHEDTSTARPHRGGCDEAFEASVLESLITTVTRGRLTQDLAVVVAQVQPAAQQQGDGRYLPAPFYDKS
jgi:hypothetical protein